MRGLSWGYISLRVQVCNNHILTRNLYYNHYYPNPKHLIIGYMDPLGIAIASTCKAHYKKIPGLTEGSGRRIERSGSRSEC